uniref:Myeloid-associated differentiation marker homolog n=1 Tax=Phallusia mammillata TaxID=59560 RepID=A0A6F9DKX0_9ASCI|nr:myeloid-associated differentiation marker homolog [Phallusia mammillata]
MGEKLWMRMGWFRLVLIGVGLAAVGLTSWEYLNILVLVRFIYFLCTGFSVFEALNINVFPETLQTKIDANKQILVVKSHLYVFILCLLASIIQAIFIFPYNENPADYVSTIWGFILSLLYLINVWRVFKDGSVQAADILRNRSFIAKLPPCLFGAVTFSILELSGYPCYYPYDNCNFSFLWVHYAFILIWMVSMTGLYLVLTNSRLCCTAFAHCILTAMQFVATLVVCRFLSAQVKELDPNFPDGKLSQIASVFGYITLFFYFVEFVVLCACRKMESK